MNGVVPVIDYNQFLAHLTDAFIFRYGDSSSDHVRMVGIVFARPSSSLAKSEIIPALADWHHRSGDHVDFFFAGYHQHALLPDLIPVPIPGIGEWGYSPEVFNSFRQEIESKTK